ncbi:DNA adenine methylase [Microbacterium sp. R1]|uniref:DNA adenine methylase n=1 Tax=Microbacterium sp. R1 TaxID=322686 RepID=UPI00187D17A0|nr:DNA adenine methylase [Microbacterium sp. R1]MBE7952911.1 DNA adenine methylase [Microbacterium sp. R1]
MPITDSPLRYPGGKSALFDAVVDVIDRNGLRGHRYAEPYAGGGGLALSLLYGRHVHRIALNDLDPAIYSMWWSILNENSDFVSRISSTPITIDEWHAQRSIYFEGDIRDPVTLGFSALFLNRTNRSGVIKGGVIGGLSQTGNYLLDCRFNRDNLRQKVERIWKYRAQIELSRQDGRDFLRDHDQRDESTLFFVDPPYFVKGRGLYSNYFEDDDHNLLSQRVLGLKNPWLLTYDDADTIADLYQSQPLYRYSIRYSAAVKRTGTELLATSRGLAVAFPNMQRVEVAQSA